MSCDVLKPIEIFFSLFFNVYKMRRNIDVIFAKCNRWPWMDIPGVWIIIIRKKALVIFRWFWFYLIKFWDAGVLCFSWCFYFFILLREGNFKERNFMVYCVQKCFHWDKCMHIFSSFSIAKFKYSEKISLNNTWNTTT